MSRFVCPQCGGHKTFYATICQQCAIPPMPQRFWWKVEWTPGCLLWTGSKDGKGYGTFKWNGKVRRAHIVAFLLQGGTIPKGMMLDHLCRNPACVNPAHLEVVDNRMNVLRGAVPARGEVPTCKRGHAYPVEPKRASDGSRVCQPCYNELKKQWVARNPERAREIKRASRQKARARTALPFIPLASFGRRAA